MYNYGTFKKRIRLNKPTAKGTYWSDYKKGRVSNRERLISLSLTDSSRSVRIMLYSEHIL